MFKKLNKKGFTLAELLVVVAIIGVLVAISIPIFTSQLEKAREATDAANFRAAYAEAQVASLDNDGKGGTATTEVTVKATDPAYAKIGNPTIGDKTLSALSVVNGKTYTLSTDSDGKVSVTEKSSKG